ncbi:MAG: TonB family protein [Ghiorsea sp.]
MLFVKESRARGDKENTWLPLISLCLATTIHIIFFIQLGLWNHPEAPIISKTNIVEVNLIPSASANEASKKTISKPLPHKPTSKQAVLKAKVSPMPVIHKKVRLDNTQTSKNIRFQTNPEVKKHVTNIIHDTTVEIKSSERNSDAQVASKESHEKALHQQYIRSLITIVKSHKTYPYSARRRHIEGLVMVSFTVGSSGVISDLQIKGKTAILNKASMNAIQASIPFPLPPTELKAPIHSQFMMQYTLK